MTSHNVRKLLPAKAGSSRSQGDSSPNEEMLPAFEAGQEQSAPSIVLTPLGVIAFEHNVDLHCTQVEIDNCVPYSILDGFLIPLR
jgi:hypothetical protein